MALILDAIFGEPDWLWRRVPHPAVLMGRLVGFLEGWLNRENHLRVRGIAAVVILVISLWIIGYIFSLPVFHGVFEVLGTAILLAQRSLSQHVRTVASSLRVSLTEGRAAVARIVGRDPESLDETGVARAAIESAAENWSDGLFAPAFWFLIAGLPGIAVYKVVNTADSMIGHRSERYAQFGWAAARLDDVLNFVPARLAGLLICLVGGRRPAMKVMLRDAGKHKSVNAGWPETAVAASLGVALAGPRVYDGVATDDPFLNSEGRRDPTPTDIEDAATLTWMAWAALLTIATIVGALSLL